MKAVGTYVTREEAEAVRAEMMKRPATPYQDSPLQDCFRMFKEAREYKGRSDKARELYDIAWKYLRPLWHFKKSVLLSVSCIAQPLAGVSWMPTLHLS